MPTPEHSEPDGHFATAKQINEVLNDADAAELRTLLVRLTQAVSAQTTSGDAFQVPLAELSPPDSKSAEKTARRYMNYLKAALQLLVHSKTGLVLQPVESPGALLQFRWNKPKCEVVDRSLSSKELKKLPARIQPLVLKDLTREEFPRDAVLTTLGHIDGALWPNRPGPTIDQHRIAMKKMNDAPETYTLFVRRDAAAPSVKESRSHVVDGYINLWRKPKGDGKALLLECLDNGNVRTDHPQEEWAAPKVFPTPRKLDGVFTAVQLAPYMRSRTRGKPLDRRWLLRAIVRMLFDDAKRRVFYENLYFRLTHEDEAEFLRELAKAGRTVIWLPRPSCRELLVCLAMLEPLAPSAQTSHPILAEVDRLYEEVRTCHAPKPPTLEVVVLTQGAKESTAAPTPEPWKRENQASRPL